MYNSSEKKEGKEEGKKDGKMRRGNVQCIADAFY